MKSQLFVSRVVHVLVACLTVSICTPVLASNNWTNSASGLWQVTNNWSSGRAPDTTSGQVLITNANTKTVTIDAATPAANLTINNLTLSAPPGATNTLLLADLGTNQPLRLVGGSGQSALAIYKSGAVSVTNSSLVLTGNFLVPIYFTLWGGSLTLDDGAIVVRSDDPANTNHFVAVRLGRTDSTSPPSRAETARLNINQGTMEAEALYLGSSPAPNYSSQGSLNLAGGALTILAEFSVGADVSCTGIVSVTGGQLVVPAQVTNVIRIGDHGLGQMTISGGSVTLPTVSVGRHDTGLGLLTVESNGLAVFTDDVSIGRFAGATGIVLVAEGRLFATNQDLWVGREGAGQLTVSNGAVQARRVWVAPTNTAQGTLQMAGGSFIIDSSLVVGTEGTGQVFMAGGTVSVTNAANTAFVNIPRGLLTLSGGTLTADTLLLTNPAGHFVFSGGTLRLKGSSVSNGAPFVVGDGVNPATFELTGGIHSFENGLVISSNATLSGCGTIIGPITSYGTIATNCAGTPARPRITRVFAATNTFSFSFDSVTGLNYFIEYKDALTDPAWLPLTNRLGTGGLLTIFQSPLPGRSRFYRVRVE